MRFILAKRYSEENVFKAIENTNNLIKALIRVQLSNTELSLVKKIELLDVEDLPTIEIADILSTSPNFVSAQRSLLHKKKKSPKN